MSVFDGIVFSAEQLYWRWWGGETGGVGEVGGGEIGEEMVVGNMVAAAAAAVGGAVEEAGGAVVEEAVIVMVEGGAGEAGEGTTGESTCRKTSRGIPFTGYRKKKLGKGKATPSTKRNEMPTAKSG